LGTAGGEEQPTGTAVDALWAVGNCGVFENMVLDGRSENGGGEEGPREEKARDA